MMQYKIYPPSISNQITAEYYFHLIGQINRGTCSRKAIKIIHRNGSYIYETYHLVDFMWDYTTK